MMVGELSNNAPKVNHPIISETEARKIIQIMICENHKSSVGNLYEFMVRQSIDYHHLAATTPHSFSVRTNVRKGFIPDHLYVTNEWPVDRIHMCRSVLPPLFELLIY